jgi:hypothetical protein
MPSMQALNGSEASMASLTFLRLAMALQPTLITTVSAKRTATRTSMPMSVETHRATKFNLETLAISPISTSSMISILSQTSSKARLKANSRVLHKRRLARHQHRMHQIQLLRRHATRTASQASRPRLRSLMGPQMRTTCFIASARSCATMTAVHRRESVGTCLAWPRTLD